MATTAIVDVASAAQANFKGFNNITMTNWTSATLKPLIAIGSTFEVGGTIYQTAAADQDTDPAAAWAGLAAGLVYLYATAAAGAITFSVSSTAPTWDTAKQGYYNGAARCLGLFIKTSGGDWSVKTILTHRGDGYTKSLLIPLVLDIGDWNMDATATIAVAIPGGVSTTKQVRCVDVMIRNDADNTFIPLASTGSAAGVNEGSIDGFVVGNIYLSRVAAGIFDSVNYDSTSYNRGWITLWLQPF